MRFDVYADLANLYMLNFSARLEALRPLVPEPLELHAKDGRGFPSIVLPRIENLRPVRTRFPRVDYELFGLRILVDYNSRQLGHTKGIYFARLVMDPEWVRLAARLFSTFDFDPGRIEKSREENGEDVIEVTGGGGNGVLRARVTASDHFPDQLTAGSCFATAGEALATYNDIAYGFIPAGRSGVHVLQIADPHPNYVAWPLRHMTVHEIWVESLHGSPPIADGLTLEPSYFVGPLPRYWRWLATEPA